MFQALALIVDRSDHKNFFLKKKLRHRYRRGHGFISRTGLNFFQVQFTTTRFSSVLSCEDLLISSFFLISLSILIKHSLEKLWIP